MDNVKKLRTQNQQQNPKIIDQANNDLPCTFAPPIPNVPTLTWSHSQLNVAQHNQPAGLSAGAKSAVYVWELLNPGLDHALLSMVHLVNYFLRFNKVSRSANGL
jgi:hypothetical protein